MALRHDSRMRALFALSTFVAFGVACSRPAWRPAFDARCHCGETSLSATTTAASEVADAPWCIARLQDVTPDVVADLFFENPEPFDERARDALVASRLVAEREAEKAVDALAPSLRSELVCLRRERDALRDAGDEAEAIETDAAMWRRYQEAMQALRDAAAASVRGSIALPAWVTRLETNKVADRLKVWICHDVIDREELVQSMLGPIESTLTSFLRRRAADASSPIVDEIASKVAESRRARFVTAMTK